MTQNKNKSIVKKEEIVIELNDLDLLNHRYEVVSTIQEGEFSQVFKVKDYNDNNM